MVDEFFLLVNDKMNDVVGNVFHSIKKEWQENNVQTGYTMDGEEFYLGYKVFLFY